MCRSGQGLSVRFGRFRCLEGGFRFGVNKLSFDGLDGLDGLGVHRMLDGIEGGADRGILSGVFFGQLLQLSHLAGGRVGLEACGGGVSLSGCNGGIIGGIVSQGSREGFLGGGQFVGERSLLALQELQDGGDAIREGRHGGGEAAEVEVKPLQESVEGEVHGKCGRDADCGPAEA